MTWEVALVGAVGAAAFSFIYVGCNMRSSDSDDQLLLFKYLGLFLIVLGFWTLSSLPVVGNYIINATVTDTSVMPDSVGDKLTTINDGAFKVLIRVSVMLFTVFFFLFFWDLLKLLISRKRAKEAKESNGDFS